MIQKISKGVCVCVGMRTPVHTRQPQMLFFKSCPTWFLRKGLPLGPEAC